MQDKKIINTFVALASLFTLSLAFANSMVIPINLVAPGSEKGKAVGTIKLEDSICGVLLTPNLHDLPPGIHGFHVHVKADCGDKGMAAGGHLDPAGSNEHNGPYSHAGHLGDLPILLVDANGKATLPTLAPKFKLAAIKGHALMIHAGGDNYSDQPEKLGGGGERIACGIIEDKAAKSAS